MDPSRPHDKYFRSVFSNVGNAASLFRVYVPERLARTLKWSTLTLLPGRFVSPDWRDSGADLLFSVEREPGATLRTSADRSDGAELGVGARSLDRETCYWK